MSTLPRRVSAGPRPRKSCDPVGQGTPCHCERSSSNASRCRACGRRHPPPLFFRRAPPDAARHPPPRPPLNAQRAARPGRPLPPRSRQPPLRPAWRTGIGARAPRRPRRWRRPAAGVASHTNGQSQGARRLACTRCRGCLRGCSPSPRRSRPAEGGESSPLRGRRGRQPWPRCAAKSATSSLRRAPRVTAAAARCPRCGRRPGGSPRRRPPQSQPD